MAHPPTASPALSIVLAAAVSVVAPPTSGATNAVRVGTFDQSVATSFTTVDGLPDDDVRAIETTPNGVVFAGTARGLARFEAGRWSAVEGLIGRPVSALALSGQDLYVSSGDDLVHLSIDEAPRPRSLTSFAPTGRRATLSLAVATGGESVYVGREDGLWHLTLELERPRRGAQSVTTVSRLALEEDLHRLLRELGPSRVVHAVATAPGGRLAVAAEGGLLLRPSSQGDWRRLLPRQGERSWAPVKVRGASFDSAGRLWFVSPQGVGCYDLEDGTWRLYEARDGLPLLGLTAVAPGAHDVWLGTGAGAVRYRFSQDELNAGTWEYRQGRRWLPNDDVRSISVDGEGSAWIATSGGVGRIEPRPMTLEAKARFFEDEIDRYHRRTPYEFVDGVHLTRPGDKTELSQRDSDNDGLWTGMYGAAQCFAYAATGSLKARRRAKKAFEALAFLSEVTQGGTPPALPGFIARTILPTDGPDPNLGREDEDRRRKAEVDRLWKLITPRWPVSEDKRWYWKTDASSDELDGHFFLYALYYDLVADGEEERRRVRQVVRRVTDHLLDHDLSLVDHDGRATRWAVFGPRKLNHDQDWWGERGLNSLSVLSYLRVAAHVTGEGRYAEVAHELIREHAYAANVRAPKVHAGPGTGNQSDDEMAFMGFYNLIRYETDTALREIWLHAFFRYWQMEQGERNPLFHFLYAASVEEGSYEDAFGQVPLAPYGDWLEDSLDTLRRFPLDRVNWRHENRHRQDIVFLDPERARGHRRDGKVLPVDERHVEHWNHDPWALDSGGDGRRLADGAAYLLPYYLGLYHRFFVED